MNERTGRSQRSAGAPDASQTPGACGDSWAAAFSVYGALDDVALIALGNRGLLRRGRAELAAGRVEPVNGSIDPEAGEQPVPGTVTIGVGRPAVPVTLTVSGPQDARCPCPVAGICVHILAACLWLREAVNRDGADESTTAAETPTNPASPDASVTPAPAQGPPSDPVLEEVLAWKPADVEKSLGAEARRRAQASLAGMAPDRLAASTEVTSAPGRLSITWPDAPEIVVIAGLGPRGMIVSGRHSSAANAAWCLQAVIRLFARAGRAWPWPDEKTTFDDRKRDVVSTVATSIETLLSAGLSHAGLRSATNLERLAQVTRLEELPRLSRLLTSAAGRLRALAERNDALDEATVLSALAAAWSLTRALETTSAAPDPALLGRADAERVQPGLLMPLSATWWLAPSGSRGLTARFWDVENCRLESVTTGRAAGADPTFQRAENIPLVWGASVRALLSGPLRLTGATRRSDGALAPSARTTVRHCGGYDDIDLAAIAHELRALQRGPGAASFEAPLPPVRLMLPDPSGLGRIDLDEIHQQYVWPVRDTAGEEHLLRLVPDSREAALIAAVLTRDLPVVAMTVEGDHPVGIYVLREGALALLSPSISSIRAGDLGFYRRLTTRLERLRAEAATPTPPPSASGLIESLCEDLHEALTTMAASGALHTEGMVGWTAHVLTSRARRARELQLETLAAALTRVEEEPGPQAILRACAVVDRIRALTR